MILEGVPVKTSILDSLKVRIPSLREKHGRAPGLAVILVGEDPASQAYVSMKKKACESIGIASFEYKRPSSISESELVSLILSLNEDPLVDGILLQLPLPKGLDADKMLSLIDPSKDVDGFHPVNVGKLVLGLPTFKSCTPYGVCKLLEYYSISTEGKHVVILGRSNIVGKPLAVMLMQKQVPGNATVTVCHSKSENLAQITSSADILIAAIGVPYFVTKEMVKPGAVVIDVGINRVEDSMSASGYKLVGDVDYESVSQISSAITPVPGGVGPLTIAMLMTNTVQSFEQRI